MKNIIIATAITLGTLSSVSAKEFTMQSAFGGLPVLDSTAKRFVSNVNTLTNGDVELNYLLAGELSPPFEIFDNVSAGAIDAAWSYAAYASGKEPAAALFGSVPFGGDPLSYVSWLHHGGGLELWQEIYEPYNLKIRIGGLGGAILGKVGANAQSLPAGEISTSLETGRLDATELSFEVSCADANLYAMGEAAGAQSAVLQEFRDNGVDVKRFPDNVMDALRKAADEVYAEKSAEDPMFKRVIESYRSYADSYNEYQALSDLK